MVERVAGASAATTVVDGAPLKWMIPRPRGPLVWASPLTYGGGLLGGDHVRFDVEVGAHAGVFVGAAGATKIFRADGRRTVVDVDARVGSGGFLLHAPPPVSPFAGSVSRSQVRLHVAPDARVVWIDGLVGGRLARGERWQMGAYESRIELWGDGPTGAVQVAREAIALDADAPLGETFDALTTIVLGGALAPVEERLRAWAAEPPRARGPDACLVSWSPFAASAPLAGGVLRAAAARPATLAALVDDALSPLRTWIPGLEDAPWHRLGAVERTCS